MLAFMALPTIVSIIEDSIVSVPRNYKEGSLALGATHWQTIYRVILPAASSGILAAVMLGIGRVIGETMAVLMITGNAAVMPTSLLQPVRTLTATIAAEMGETVRGSSHYFSLFAIGIILFIISFIINLLADRFMHKKS
jgi:phosphate transport system permease protein